MIKSGNYIIIPVEAMSLVVEAKEGKLHLVGNFGNEFGVEKILNETRRAVHNIIKWERTNQEKVNRAWKKYNVSKEFMEPFELSLSEEMWNDFNIDRFNRQSTELIGGFDKAFFEITDLMLEYDVAVEQIEDEQKAEVKTLSMDQVKGLLDGFGKKE